MFALRDNGGAGGGEAGRVHRRRKWQKFPNGEKVAACSAAGTHWQPWCFMKKLAAKSIPRRSWLENAHMDKITQEGFIPFLSLDECKQDILKVLACRTQFDISFVMRFCSVFRVLFLNCRGNNEPHYCPVRKKKNKKKKKITFLGCSFFYSPFFPQGKKEVKTFGALLCQLWLRWLRNWRPSRKRWQQAARPKSNAGALAVPTRNSTIPRTWLNIVSVN